MKPLKELDRITLIEMLAREQERVKYLEQEVARLQLERVNQTVINQPDLWSKPYQVTSNSDSKITY